MNMNRLSFTLVLLLVLMWQWPTVGWTLPLPPSHSMHAQETPQVACLKAVYGDWKKYRGFGADKRKELKKYFECFPSDFKTFNSLAYFGERSMRTPPFYIIGALVDHGFTYISVLLPLTRKIVGKSEYEGKLISLGVGAKFDQLDAPELLQSFIDDELSLDPAGMLQSLSQKAPSEIKTFWRFMVTTDTAPKMEAKLCSTHGSRGLLACKILREVIRKGTLRPPPTC